MTLDIALLNCVALDLLTFQLTVREQTRHWFHTTHEVKTYVIDVRARAVMGGDSVVMDSDRRWRCWELLMTWRAEQRLDEYVGLSSPPCVPYAIRGPLPPCPAPLLRR